MISVNIVGGNKEAIMKKIYFDNGATSFPKAPGVGEAMLNAINNVGGSVNRGVSSQSMQSEHVIYETREMLCELFEFEHPENVIFTKNVTESINLVLKSFLKPGDHVIVSSVEHNAVMRPLHILKEEGVRVTKIPVTLEGKIDFQALEAQINQATKLIIMTHGSNVTGTVLPLEEVGQIAQQHGVRFVVDVAQSAGHRRISMKTFNCDALCFTGHKGLLGPQGIGGLLIRDDFAKVLTSYIQGGTGSKSNSEIQPSYMPDKFESGTPNIPGIYGLNAALHYLKEKDVEVIHKIESDLVDYFVEAIKEAGIEAYIGPDTQEKRSNVVSIDFKAYDNAIISSELVHTYGVSNRCGMHCAPSAHESFGTFPQGTVRLSISHFNTKEEIDYVVESIKSIQLAY